MATLSELLSMDPEELTEEQQYEIVDKLRADRKVWVQSIATARQSGKRPTGRMPKNTTGIRRVLTIDDLGEIEIE